MSCASLFQRKQPLLPHLIAVSNKVMQFSLRMLLSSLKQQLEEQKEGSNDLMLPVKPQLRSGGVGWNRGLIYHELDKLSDLTR